MHMERLPREAVFRHLEDLAMKLDLLKYLYVVFIEIQLKLKKNSQIYFI